ncbi:uncharacterized protein LOC105387765 [Plutella xylostella]|uniref:uncharacterized protein LOC105387765 n=1 Tax=Plutella xylostella TaxID=51655 RepID=UPI002032C19F|nr:uncharacterized protein LOC105387765 [Plutella xylostella]
MVTLSKLTNKLTMKRSLHKSKLKEAVKQAMLAQSDIPKKTSGFDFNNFKRGMEKVTQKLAMKSSRSGINIEVAKEAKVVAYLPCHECGKFKAKKYDETTWTHENKGIECVLSLSQVSPDEPFLLYIESSPQGPNFKPHFMLAGKYKEFERPTIKIEKPPPKPKPEMISTISEPLFKDPKESMPTPTFVDKTLSPFNFQKVVYAKQYEF